MKKVFLIFFILILLLGIWFVLRFVIGGPEDDWICVNNQWVKHGSPSAPMPTSDCGEKDSSLDKVGTNLILYDVPFISQAPFGQWENPIYQNACEEAALLMAIKWVKGEQAISKEQASEKLKNFADFETEKYNNFYDHSIQDTAQIMRDYFNYNNIEVKENISIEDIKNELAEGNLVIVPINGQELKNPYYTPPGPAEHMILIIGYDFQTQEFITNDAGTRHGEKYRYDENRFYDSIRDYPTGYKEPILEIKKSMIVIMPNK